MGIVARSLGQRARATDTRYGFCAEAPNAAIIRLFPPEVINTDCLKIVASPPVG